MWLFVTFPTDFCFHLGVLEKACVMFGIHLEIKHLGNLKKSKANNGYYLEKLLFREKKIKYAFPIKSIVFHDIICRNFTFLCYPNSDPISKPFS